MTRAAALLLTFAACSGREPEAKPAPRETPPVREVSPVPAPDPVPLPTPPAQPTSMPKAQCEPFDGKACVGDTVVACSAEGTIGARLDDCNGGCKRGSCVDTCAIKGVELIYVVDSGHNLVSFDPQKLPGDPFHRIGKLTCNPAARPFSMAVDRHGIAWVLYNTGTLYRVSILDAHCSLAGSPEDAPVTYGMGFVRDSAKSTSEKLFVSANDDSQMFAQLDTSVTPPRWNAIKALKGVHTHHPEMTGTGDGKLFGYFPESGSGFVQEIKPSTGELTGPRRPVGTKAGTVNAFAFAHWGGVFYVFVTIDGNSMVHAINRKTGKHEVVRENLPDRIVGAGVSTCAPELERVPGK